jgi:hypothetical protein
MMTFSDGVGDVVLVRTEEQVIGAHTCAIIAAM